MADTKTRIEVYLKTQRRLARFCRREKFISYALASEIIDNWLDVQAGKQPAPAPGNPAPVLAPGPAAVPASSSSPDSTPSPLAGRPADADPANAGNSAADQPAPPGRAGPASGAAFDPPAASPAHDSPGEAA